VLFFAYIFFGGAPLALFWGGGGWGCAWVAGGRGGGRATVAASGAVAGGLVGAVCNTVGCGAVAAAAKEGLASVADGAAPPPAAALSDVPRADATLWGEGLAPTYWEPLLGQKARPKLEFEFTPSGMKAPKLIKLKDVVTHRKDGAFFDSVAEATEAFVVKNAQGRVEEDFELEMHKFWVQLSGNQKHRPSNTVVGKRPAGQLMISMQLVPIEHVDKMKAGFGRDFPNTNPVLPKPVGRIYFTFNPCVMCLQILGPRLCRRLSCFFCIVLWVVMLYYLLPVLIGNTITSSIGNVFQRILESRAVSISLLVLTIAGAGVCAMCCCGRMRRG